MPVPNDPCHTAGGEVCILVSSGPTPNSANEGDYRGFAVTSAISLSRIVSEYGCQAHPKQSGRCGSLPEPGGSCCYGYVVRRGMVAGYLSPKCMLLCVRSSSIASYAPVCVNILRGTPCRPSHKAVGEGCRGVKRM